MKFVITMALAAAMAGPGAGDGKVDLWQRDRSAGVGLENSKIKLTGDGRRGDSNGRYSLPQPCWLERSEGPGKLYDELDRNDPGFDRSPVPEEEEKRGKGQWWQAAFDGKSKDGAACMAARDPFVWVPEGETPPGAITVRQLAEIARAELTVPKPEIRINPDEKTFVNMDTYVWLVGLDDPRKRVTATLPDFASVSVRASLQDMEIDPGTSADRADVKTDCGPKGHPYRKGAAFRCGVTYLRSAADQPDRTYTLTVTTTWEIEAEVRPSPGRYWSERVGAADAGQFEPIEVTVELPVPVDEVQSITSRD